VKKVAFVLTAIILLTLILPGCTGSTTPTGPALKTIANDVQIISLKVGATQQLKITATFDDGSTKDVTAACTYSSSVPAAAAVSATGLVTAVAAGAANIGVSYKSGAVISQIVEPVGVG